MEFKTGVNIITILLILIFFFKVFQITTKQNDIKRDNIKRTTKKKYVYDLIGDKYYYGGGNINIDYNKAVENYNKVLLYDSENIRIPEIRQNINNIIDNKNKNDENHIIINNVDFGFNYDINDYIIDIILYDEPNNIQLDEPNNIQLDEPNNIQLDEPEIPNNQIYYNDFENVHDSVVTKTITSSINKLEENTEKKLDLDKCIKYLYDNLNDDIKNKDNITKTINYIKQNSNSQIRDRNLSENLILVVNKINNTTEDEKRNNMITNLFYELNDCVRSDGNMYCLTGISNRIINSLHGNDESVVITPKWALREELMSKCGKIRDDLELILSSDDDNFTKKLKENIYIELTNEYVNKNKILTKEDLDKEIEGWIDYV